MNFRSDNVSGVAPEVLLAIRRANRGSAASYGRDSGSVQLTAAFCRLFEKEVAVFPVTTGTASNALALATVVPPHGAVLCHERAHIQEDECGAPEFYSGGAKLIALQGAHGKLTLPTVRRAVARLHPGSVHSTPLAALSVTQPTEFGTCYSPEALEALSRLAHSNGLVVHMDGARFANALVHLRASPAELTWKAGVDVLSLGFTKTGALGAECVVFFNPQLASTFEFRRKRGGHLWSKMRFVNAQLEALLEGNLWLRLSAHANTMAARLAAGLVRRTPCRVLHEVEANLVFARLPARRTLDDLRASGVDVVTLSGEDHAPVVRFACSFQTEARDVDWLIDLCIRITRRPRVKSRESERTLSARAPAARARRSATRRHA